MEKQYLLAILLCFRFIESNSSNRLFTCCNKGITATPRLISFVNKAAQAEQPQRQTQQTNPLSTQVSIEQLKTFSDTSVEQSSTSEYIISCEDQRQYDH